MPGNLRIRRNYAPDEPNRFIPGQYVSSPAGPDAFGAGLGRSLQRAGVSIQKRLDKERDDRDKFAARKAYIDAATHAQFDMQERMNNAPLGAPDFAQTVLADYEKAHGDLVTSLRESGMQEAYIQDTEIRLAGLRNSLVNQGLTFEDNSYVAKVGVDMAESGDNLAQLAQSNPSALPAAVREFNGLLDSIPNLPAIEREKLREKHLAVIRLSAGLSLAEREPNRVAGTLSSGGTFELGAAVEALKSGIQSVESSNQQAPYQAVGPRVGNDRAYGKYQVMGANIPLWTEQATGKRMSRQEFLDNPAAQEAVFEYKMTEYLERYGSVRDAASVWFTGVPYWQAVKEGRSDVNLTVQEYVGKVERNLGIANARNPLEGGDVGDPVLDLLTAGERARVLNAAQSASKTQNASAKAIIEVMEKNIQEASEEGIPYNGPRPTEEMYNTAWGPIEGPQRNAAIKKMEQIGEAKREFVTSSNSEIDAEVEALRPKDTSASTFGEENDVWQTLRTAAQEVKADRKEDPADYVTRHYPKAKDAWAIAMQTGAEGDRINAYAQMAQAYRQLGTPPSEQVPFSDEALTHITDHLNGLPPEDRLRTMANMRAQMGDALFYNGMKQVDEKGLPVDTYLAGLVAASPAHLAVASNALRGWKMVQEDKTLHPYNSGVDLAFREVMGGANHGLLPKDVNSLRNAAIGLYVANGGAPDEDNFDDSEFQASVRILLGGKADGDTGVVDMSRGAVDFNTILPPNTTEGEFRHWINTATAADYRDLANGVPTYVDGTRATADEIRSEGVFLRVSGEDYMVFMGSDGGKLQTPVGGPYVISLREDDIKASLSRSVIEGVPTPIGINPHSNFDEYGRFIGEPPPQRTPPAPDEETDLSPWKPALTIGKLRIGGNVEDYEEYRRRLEKNR